MTLRSRRDFATAVLLGVCGLGWVAIAAVDFTIAATTDGPFPAHPLHSLSLAVLITGTLSCLLVRAIQIGSQVLRRLAGIEHQHNQRLAALVEPSAGTYYHHGRNVARARVHLAATAPTVDLAEVRATRVLRQQTVPTPIMEPPDAIDSSWRAYQAGLADRAFPLAERDADDDVDDDREDGSSSVA